MRDFQFGTVDPKIFVWVFRFFSFAYMNIMRKKDSD